MSDRERDETVRLAVRRLFHVGGKKYAKVMRAVARRDIEMVKCLLGDCQTTTDRDMAGIIIRTLEMTTERKLKRAA